MFVKGLFLKRMVLYRKKEEDAVRATGSFLIDKTGKDVP